MSPETPQTTELDATAAESADDGLTVGQVSTVLGYRDASNKAVLRLIQRGEFPNACFLGRAYRIPRGDVLKMLKRKSDKLKKSIEKKRLERENETARAGRDADPGASSGAGATA